MSGHFSFSLCEDFLGKISKPPTNKDLASMTVPFSEFMIDHRSYAHNLSCCERDSNPWPLRYRFSALPTELSSQLGAGHIVSSYFVFRVSHLACSTCCCEKWREGLLWTTNFNFAARSSSRFFSVGFTTAFSMNGETNSCAQTWPFLKGDSILNRNTEINNERSPPCVLQS